MKTAGRQELTCLGAQKGNIILIKVWRVGGRREREHSRPALCNNELGCTVRLMDVAAGWEEDTQAEGSAILVAGTYIKGTQDVGGGGRRREEIWISGVSLTELRFESALGLKKTKFRP